MRPTITRRRIRRPASREVVTFKKDSQQEPSFFGGTAHESFFKPAIAMPQAQVQRKCTECEKEDKLQRSTDKEEKVQKKELVQLNGASHHNTIQKQEVPAPAEPVPVAPAVPAPAVPAPVAPGAPAAVVPAPAAPGVAPGVPAPAVPGPAGPAAVAPEPPAPHFRDCVQSVTGRDDADVLLNRAMQLATGFVNTAIGLLANDPIPGSIYETALALHFGSPLTERARLRLRTVYQRILGNFTVANFICNRTACPDGHTQAMWEPSDDLLHICRPFWPLDRVCQAVVLIHEAAHDAGIDTIDDPTTPGDDHTPNRGTRSYPVAGAPPTRRRVPIRRRANTPDAFAFFAAHVHNNVDTPGDCFN